MSNVSFSSRKAFGLLRDKHGGNIYEMERRHKRSFIDFSANINPLGLPAAVKKAIYANFDKILHYPDPGAGNVTRRIAEYWGIKEENVLVGNGSVDLIYLIVSVYRPKTTLIPAPTFSEYESAAKSVKSRVRFLKLKEKDGFRFSLPRSGFVGSAPGSPHARFGDTGKADVFFLCNPNNPTGNLILEDPGRIEKADSKLLVIDETFMDFLPDQRNHTLIWKAVKSRKIAVLRTFTKFFALPGLRIGYVIAHREVIDKLRKHQPPWSTNALAQIAAELVINKKYINTTHKFIKKERKFLSRQLTGIDGLKPYPSAANFLLIKIEKRGITSKSLKERVIKKGILIRDCGNFRNLSDKYIRVAVRSRKENLKLLAALGKVL